MKQAIVVMSMVIGLMGGLLLGRDRPAAESAAWRRLPLAPVELIELPFATPGLVYARSSDGDLYGCDSMGMSCWLPTTAPRMGRGGAMGAGAPCDRFGPAFRGAGAQPMGIDDYIERLDSAADGWLLTVTVLDNRGAVWQWSGPTAPAAAKTPGLGLAVVGALIGLVIGLGLWSTLAPRTP
ncbi:MAG TPA: hypothetical protein VD886_11420 [Herpetosiphonaceae bacterium]|nr:hypothetical protein [Herpetosiphonaceae bacterium]